MPNRDRHAALMICANTGLPVPESTFHKAYFSKQTFDECYRELRTTPSPLRLGCQ